MSATLEIQRKCVEMLEQGLSYRDVYVDYYSTIDPKLAYESFRRKLAMWKKKDFPNSDLLEKAQLNEGQKAYAATVQINGAGEVTQAWVRTKNNDSMYMKLIEEVKNMPPIPYRRTVSIRDNGKMVEIALYDMHFGINTLKDYQETLEDILEILERPLKEVVIVIGQDLFHNDDFRGRTTSGTPIEQVNMETAWRDAREFYATIIMASPVKPKIVFSQGNHDESMGWAFVQMLKAQFPDLEVDDSRRDRKIIVFGKNVIGITHGDKVRGKPINLRSIFSIEFPMEFAMAKVKEIHAGHLHHEKSEDTYGVMCRTLCTANKTDDWHSDKGFVGQNKRFMVFEWTEEKLKSIHYV